MKNKEYRDLSTDELVSQIDGLKKELFNLRFQAATAQLSNPMRIREVKRSIARAKTILTQKENQ
ncbi:50S ribosomal protein L29 [endosymbiont 'TC1' of Trimyema compressum]|uniref:50S ribosomal protein L29 n=1 Tax=endosymbiont 'TC1' of Trimyema compressum TaxID=243899 RepID=UPI0007F089B3|nr:50S ribosomal protein L29 [endosymbiont 'TC1' of Trimyema compressum]AMP20329.1 50S ribosomal protein L29 [endosymbiont 'TC1' of Trimyema compressum]